MEYLRPSTAARRFPIDDGLLLLNASSNSLSVYNQTARQVWDFLERGLSVPEVAAELSDRYGVPRGVASEDVRAILEQWLSSGLVVAEGLSDPPPVGPRPQVATDWSRAPEPQWALTLTCTIRDKVFAFAIEPARDVYGFRMLFKHLETLEARPDLRLEVREAGDGESAFVLDGIERMRSNDEGQLLGAVNQTILAHIHPGVEWLAIIHGGALGRNGAGIMFPAPRGSGKTTLVAYLLAHGYDYLADDLIALSLPEGRIVPWPLPLSVKVGSWELLSETYEDLPTFPQHRTLRGEVRQIVPSREVWDTEPVPVRAIVFPRYTAGAAVELTRLTPFEALQRLLGDEMWLGYPITEAGVRRFLAWLETKTAYQLVHSNVAEAARCIESVG